MALQAELAKRRRNSLFVLNLILYVNGYTWGQCQCDTLESPYYFSIQYDSTTYSGIYWIRDCRTSILLDSAGFDNYHNPFCDEIKKMFDKGMRCISDSEKSFIDDKVWYNGERIVQNNNGYRSVERYTVKLSKKGIYKNVAVGEARIYINGILTSKNYHDENGDVTGAVNTFLMTEVQ